MKSSAKIYSSKSRTVFVISPPNSDGCPRLVLAGRRGALLRDDYKGSLPLGRGLASKLCSF